MSNQIFNLGNTVNNVRKSEIADIIKTKFLPDLKIIRGNEDQDLRSYRVDFYKIENLLDFKLEKTLEEAIYELINLVKNKLVDDFDNPKFRNH